MAQRKDLFGFDVPSGVEVVPVIAAPDGRLSVEQKRFNRLVAKVEKSAQKLAAYRELADAHRQRHAQKVEPLLRQQEALCRQMALKLHDRLRTGTWTKTQTRTMKEIVCALAEPFAAGGDPEMQQLHDRYSPHSLAQKNEAALADAAGLLEEFLGVSFEGSERFESPEDLLKEGMRRAQESARRQAEADAGPDAARAARRAEKRLHKDEAARRAAGTTLREVYRKLAGALHPDRERDAARHAERTALMSEANVAYERKDLLAMLKLQLKIEQIDADAMSRIARDKLEAMTTVLKEQAESLAAELALVEGELRVEFDLPPMMPISAAALTERLMVQEHRCRVEIESMQRDLRSVGDDRTLKTFLAEQRRLMRQPDVPDLADIEAFLQGGPHRRRRR